MNNFYEAAEALGNKQEAELGKAEQATKVTITLKGEDGSYKHSTPCYKDITARFDDPVLSAIIEEAKGKFKDRPEEIRFKIEGTR